MADDNITFSADDLIGILIHNANQVSSHLGVHGLMADVSGIRQQLRRMDEVAERLESMMQAAREAAAGRQPEEHIEERLN